MKELKFKTIQEWLNDWDYRLKVGVPEPDSLKARFKDDPLLFIIEMLYGLLMLFLFVAKIAVFGVIAYLFITLVLFN